MKTIRYAAALLLLPLVLQVMAGDLDPPAAPNSTGSAMFRIEDIYNRLNTGAQGTKRAGGFAEPAGGPGNTGRTLDEVMGKAPAVDVVAAGAADVLEGTRYWGLKSGEWGKRAGTMPNVGKVVIWPGTSPKMIAKGYHDGSGYVYGDSDLVSGNIRAGVDIYSVTGKTAVVDTSSGDAVSADIAVGKKAWVDGVEITGSGTGGGGAGVPKTGQTTMYENGDDGHYEKGVAWPIPRFTNNGNGTVTDNLTGLVWLQRASVFVERSWSQALGDCSNLDNTDYVWLTDGSIPGDWRLPNVRELQSLIDYSESSPAVPDGDPFADVPGTGTLNFYWTSTTYAYNTTQAWQINLFNGALDRGSKLYTNIVWPVRDP